LERTYKREERAVVFISVFSEADNGYCLREVRDVVGAAAGGEKAGSGNSVGGTVGACGQPNWAGPMGRIIRTTHGIADRRENCEISHLKSTVSDEYILIHVGVGVLVASWLKR
jgi:hypothetical protein